MITKQEIEPYLHMSPFEVKDILLKLAQKSVEEAQKKGKEVRRLNAGRGNPNFLNTTVRQAFDFLSLFAAHVAENFSPHQDLGFRPQKEGITKTFQEYMKRHNHHKGAEFLRKAIDFALKKFNFDSDEFLFELTDAALGDFYPVPPRIFPYIEKICREYLFDALCVDEKTKKMDFELFATEGATAAMIYIFHALEMNGILKKGDEIALITPIFSPYLEIPMLSEFSLHEVFLETTEENEWQLPDSEIEKLANPKVKALFFVNPTNPTSVSISTHSLIKIANLVKTQRPDLIILTDTVYATYVDDFHSIINEIPENTICVYSYSKYYGVTGWRLGIIMLAKNNIIDKLLTELSDEQKKILHQRYETVTPNPEHFTFMERLVSDSREQALAHTGGLSCPQQTIMSLFSLYNLMDEKKEYKAAVHKILKKRIDLFFTNLDLTVPEEMGHTYYYAFLDIRTVAAQKYEKNFADFLEKKVHPFQFFFDLAQRKYTVCLPGDGFHGPDWSLRISLANLNDEEYIDVGKNIKDLLDEYHEEWKKEHL